MIRIIEKSDKLGDEITYMIGEADGKYALTMSPKIATAFSIFKMACMFKVSDNKARNLVAEYQNRLDNDSRVLAGLKARNNLISEIVYDEIAIAKFFKNINRIKRKISMRNHSIDSGVDVSAIRLVLDGQFDKVTVDEWINTIRYFSSVYPFTLPGYNK